MMTKNDKIIPTNITEVMERAYIDYSMSVIISRALPDARDGLKPVQRRILYAMLREGLLSQRPFDKCAGVVGEVLKNYHPHGDASVYDTLVRLGQSWVMRYPLILPQGNFGSIDGDPPAAYRYTECKLAKLSEELLQDIDEDTVDFQPNYKESTVEPTVLPSALPHLLMNGSTGIAVGMTTNIPPHNLGELIDAIHAMIDNPDISLDQVAEMIQGPDFPTCGVVMGRDAILKYLKTGRGIIKVRGIVETETLPHDRGQLVIKEIPYNVNRAMLVTRIAELVNEKILTEVSDVRDESDENTRIVIELKRGESDRVVINKLFQLTALESSFGVILLALDQNRPKQMNIKEMLECYIEHRREVVYRRTAFRLRKAELRAHILEGYRIALDHLDDVVRIIRASKNREEAKIQLMASYPFSERQTDAILELRLYQLTSMEREKIDAEYQELSLTIDAYRVILGSETKLLAVVKEELSAMRKAYATPRKTQIVPAEGEFRIEDVIANEGCIITVTHQGFMKRTPVSAYRSQKRGGKGVIGTGQHEEDFVEHLFSARTHDALMFIMNNGRIYIEKVYEIPEGSRTSKGRSIQNVLSLQAGERVAAMMCFQEFSPEQYLVLCTKRGVVKKTALAEYTHCRSGGIIGIRVDEDDEVIGAQLTNGSHELILITQRGMSIRFSEDDLRDQGRSTRGVRGIRLKESDSVKAMTIVDDRDTFLIATTNGLGKRSRFDTYRKQHRGGSGLIAVKMAKNVDVAAALSIKDHDEVMIFTSSGQAVRSPVKGIRVIGRTTQGVRLVNLAKGDELIGVSRVEEIEDEEEVQD
ncbi:MAG: DNA gyrase subunit A [Puniceicoccales bacterium]|jgi:DNA gyrase subunit A|nr:DNA gyrase subunit A [Puniceicoccales bacterium]